MPNMKSLSLTGIVNVKVDKRQTDRLGENNTLQIIGLEGIRFLKRQIDRQTFWNQTSS